MNSGFDYDEYKQWAEKFNIMTSEFRLWLKQFLLQEAQRVVAKGKRRTPVDTGYLRNSWYIGNQQITQIESKRKGTSKSGNTKMQIDSKNSDVLSIKLINNVLQVEIGIGADYASYVEFGHHSYQGKYMLTISIQEVQKQLPARFNKEWLQFIKSKGVV